MPIPADLNVIVLAGGAGRRLQDVSRRFEGRPLPKQFCRYGRARSLLERTLERVEPLTAKGSVGIVTQQSQARLAREQAAPYGAQLLAQPCDRGTGTAILWAALRVARTTPGGCVLVVPSDHAFASDEAFHQGVGSAVRTVTRGDFGAVLFGAVPDSPRADYGWIVPGQPVTDGLRTVEGFVEKPSTEMAADLFASGAWWNTMVVLARADALIRLFADVRPFLAALLETAETSYDPEREIQAVFRSVSACDFSRDILSEALDLVCCRWPTDAGWCDLGTPERLQAWLDGNTINLSA